MGENGPSLEVAREPFLGEGEPFLGEGGYFLGAAREFWRNLEPIGVDLGLMAASSSLCAWIASATMRALAALCGRGVE